MRNKRVITIATLVAVIILTISVPIFASGCGDDEVASVDRVAQQLSDCDGDGDVHRGEGRGMGRMHDSQDVDRDGVCDEGAERPGDCDGDCSGDCDEADEEPIDAGTTNL